MIKRLSGLSVAGAVLVMAQSVAYAQTQITQTQVNRVRIEQTSNGLQVVLETLTGTDNSDAPSVFTTRTGNTWTANIINVQLAPEAALEQQNAGPGIQSVSVTAAGTNSIQVTVVGADAPLEGERVVDSSADSAAGSAIVFNLQVSDDEAIADTTDPNATDPDTTDPDATNLDPAVPNTADEGQSIRLVVTGEQVEDPPYLVPEASTATRTDTRLIDVPNAIQVIPSEVLQDQRVVEVDEALRNVSGATVDTTEGSGLQVGLRGFSAARILRDGFSTSSSGALAITGLLALPELSNVEQIEVLKGPASILYGEIQPGGAVNFITEVPTDEPQAEGGLELGSRGFYRPYVDVSEWLNAEGSARFRLNGSFQSEDSFRGFDQGTQRTFVAPVMAFDLSDRTHLILDLEYLSDQRASDSGLVAIGNRVADLPRDRIAGEPGDRLERDFLSTGYRLEHKINDRWTFRNAFRVSAQSYEANAFTPLRFDETTGQVSRLNAATQWYQDYYGLQTDITGTFDTGNLSHTLLFGVDMSQDRSDIVAKADLNLANLSPLNIFDPTYGAAERMEFEDFPDVARDQYSTTSRLGVFLQDQVDLTDSLKVLAGLRYEIVNQELTNGVSLLDPAGRTFNQTVDAFTPRLGVVYQPVPELSLYTSYSRSFTPNGSTTLAGEFLEAEEGEGFEVGIKTELFNQRLFATLAYFDITKTNVATPDPDAPAFAQAFLATGEQRSQGIELDITGELSSGWDVLLSYAYTDARVTQDNATPVGNQLIGIPEHSASLWTTYTIQSGGLEGLGFGLGLNYVGQRPGDLLNSFELEDYWLTNASVFYERDQWQVGLNFKNLFDTDYIQGTPISRTRGIEAGEPFTVLGSVSFQF
ncbi:MAG: TonB-dependent siderophore receptor [Phormidesmis sp.]